MKNVNDLIKDISEEAGISVEEADAIVLAMVNSLNNGAIGRGSLALSNLNKIANRKMRPDKIINDISNNVDYNIEHIKFVVDYMFENVIRPTVKKGGMPAMLAMLKYMKPKNIHKVSAIIPNYNYAKYLKRRVDSIVNQTYPIHELIILDDCSTDNSDEVIKEIINKFGSLSPLST